MSHRYWRVLITASAGGGDSACNELQLRDTISGPNLCGSGTPISGSEFSAGFIDDFAFDGVSANSWNSSGGLGTTAWIGYDFGLGNAFEVVEISYKAREDYVGNAPVDMSIQFSDDAVTWTTKWVVVGQIGWSNDEVRVFTAPTPGAKRYWRVRTTATIAGLSTTSCNDVEFHTSIGGAQAATGGTPIASSITGGFPASNAFDANAGTFWVSQFSAGMPQYIGYDLGAGGNMNFVELVYTCRNDSFGPSEALKDGAVDYSSDGVGWTPLYTFSTQSAWAAGESRTFTIAASSDVTAALTGAAGAGAVGSVSPANSHALTQAAGVGVVGSVAVGVGRALVGVSAGTAVGTVGMTSPPAENPMWRTNVSIQPQRVKVMTAAERRPAIQVLT